MSENLEIRQNEEEEFLEQRRKDNELVALATKVLKIAAPDDCDYEDPYIPLCMMYPLFSIKNAEQGHYCVSGVFQTTPGSAAMQTRILGLLMRSDGLAGYTDRYWWSRFQSMSSLNDDPKVVHYNETHVTFETVEQLEARYYQLEHAIGALQRQVMKYTTKCPWRYNFAVYERWEVSKTDNSIVRTLKVIDPTDGRRLQHDVRYPNYKLIYYAAKYGLNQETYRQLEEDIRKAMNTHVNVGFEDLCLKLCAELTNV